MTKHTVEEIVAKYVEIRDTRDAIRQRHTEELAKYQEALGKLEAWLLRKLNEDGAENIRTSAGTVFKSRRTSARVDEWEEVLDFVRKHDMWHALPRSVNKSAVEDYIKETGEAFPGVTVNTDITINVRRA